MTIPRAFQAALFLAFALPSSSGADETEMPVATPLGASVMIFHEWGLQDAPKMVELAAKLGHRQVNFVITIHCQLDENLKVLNYGLIRAKEGWQYEAFDDQLLALFQQHLTKAFTRAAALDLDIAILPHVDATGPQFGWRNEFDLDPLKICGEFSYKRVMIDTIADALEKSVKNDTHVEFALTGEMGRTVFAYPDAYRTILAEMRTREKLKNLKAGVSINFNKVTGGHPPTADECASVNQLLADSDFLGFSCYGPVSVPPKPEDFAAMATAFVAMVEEQGIIVPDDLDLHFSEVGIGGGDGTNVVPAAVASSAWDGTSDAEKNPWSTAPMRELRRGYYRALLTFLKNQASARRVTAAFLWNTGSWCPYGTDNKAFADAEIEAMIRNHNSTTPNK